MAKRKKIIIADLPDAGTVFAMPLADGRTGICRVLRKVDLDTPRILVSASDWISSGPPPLNHPAVRRKLVKNHHNWVEEPDVMWVSGPPPKEFRVIGKITVGLKDAKAESNSYGHWNAFAFQVLAQWRWDNEREAVLAEDEASQSIQMATRKDENKKRAEYLAAVTFSSLLVKDLFPTWNDYPSKAAKEGCQQLIHAFILALAGTKGPLKKNFVSKALKTCVEELNQSDSRNKNFIETIEREDLCEVLEDILNAAKFPELLERIEDWRDW